MNWSIESAVSVVSNPALDLARTLLDSVQGCNIIYI